MKRYNLGSLTITCSITKKKHISSKFQDDIFLSVEKGPEKGNIDLAGPAGERKMRNVPWVPQTRLRRAFWRAAP